MERAWCRHRRGRAGGHGAGADAKTQSGRDHAFDTPRHIRHLIAQEELLGRHKSELAHATGIRYSGELGHPFHVIDERTVVLPLDHPFVPEGRFASMLVEDAELAQNLTTGFEGLWRKAMRDLREIDFQPGVRTTGVSGGSGSGPGGRRRGGR